MRSCTSLISQGFFPGYISSWHQVANLSLPTTHAARHLGRLSLKSYIKKTGYNVIEPRDYGRLLGAAGFTDVVVDDATPRFIEILKSEADRLVTNRGEFLTSFSEADLNYLVERWAMKVGFCQAGDMKWGIYLASKKS